MTVRFSTRNSVACLLTVLFASKLENVSPVIVPFSDKSSQPYQFTHSHYLDKQQNAVLLKWRVAVVQVAEQKNFSLLEAEIAAPTHGYVGFGFSPDGGMIGADILIMWVDNAGIAHMQDRYATEYAEPLIDPDQSSLLEYSGHENETHTVFRFRRILEAGCEDPQNDYSITTSSVHLIYALGEHDPDGSGHIAYHGANKRGSQTLHLLDDSDGREERDRAAAKAETTLSLEFRVKNLTLPLGSTLYYCSLHALPKLEKDVHVVGFEPAVAPESLHVVHHFIAYICERGFVPEPEWQQFPCYQAKNDVGRARDLKHVSRCFHSIIWASAGIWDSMHFPEGIGMLLTPADSNRYMLVETHYDISQLTAPMHGDHSGIRVAITENLRPHTSSHLVFGQAPGSGLLIPGYSKIFTTPGICGSACTEKFLPPGGVNIFYAGLHTHIYGRSLALRHFRNGTELPYIVADAAHDFRYQRTRAVNVTVLPGDQVLLECNFTTINKANTTWGGWGTQDEMCMAFTFVTPALDISVCVSVLSTVHAMAALQEKNNDSIITPTPSKLLELEMSELNPPKPHEALTKGQSGITIIQDMVGLSTALREIDWKRRSDAREQLQQSYLYDPHLNFCGGYSDYLQQVETPYVKDKSETVNGQKRPTGLVQPQDLSPQC